MSSKQIFRLKVFLKKAVRKPDITKRLVWFNAFPHMPLTKKPKGMRMGKGAGKLNA
jgi:ribosomal protein L16/L10AE